jgi:hypothetical protein
LDLASRLGTNVLIGYEREQDDRIVFTFDAKARFGGLPGVSVTNA